MKFEKTSYGNRTNILKFPDHYVNVAVTVSDAGIVANADGKKIVLAGTLLGGGVVADESKDAVLATVDVVAEGVLFNDTDVTSGPAKGALLIHGFIALDKIPKAPTAEEVAALKQITFIQ